MKKVLKHIQENASDEQKLTYAFLASGTVAVLLFFVWVAGFSPVNSETVKVPRAKKGPEKEMQNNSKNNNLDNQEAAALESLGSSFYDLTSKKASNTQKEQENDYKREPFNLEI